MVPRQQDEYDVFRIPHSRMMQLVNSCNKGLYVTDFANNDALFALLSNLQNVFAEFKSHEDIENEHIMKKLKSKLKAMAIYNSAVCNCHNDDEFTPLIRLVETGYLFTDNAKSKSERLSYGVRLRKALKKFIKTFVPHMREEEEIFQPLLLKYFTQRELTDMKNIVIKMHLQKKKLNNDISSNTNQQNSSRLRFSVVEQMVREMKLDNTRSSGFSSLKSSLKLTFQEEPAIEVEAAARRTTQLSDMPDEILMKIFGYTTTIITTKNIFGGEKSSIKVSYGKLLALARVNKRWNRLCYDPSNWSQLTFAEWKWKGEQQQHKSSEMKCIEQQQHSDGECESSNEEEEGEEEEYEDQTEIIAKHKDIRTLHFWIKTVLPRVGPWITKLNMASCTALNNNLARRILQLCPNLEVLDLSYTKIGDNSFREICLEKLRHLNLEGCSKLSDDAFKNILLASLVYRNHRANFASDTTTSTVSNIDCDNNNKKKNNDNNDKTDIEDIKNYPSNEKSKNQVHKVIRTAENGLNSINLSGCWGLTDFGLSYIASKYELGDLEYLNLSGCLNLTSMGLQLFTETSDSLKGDNLFYCDNIEDGPLQTTANGCDNLECSQRFCCRAVV